MTAAPRNAGDSRGWAIPDGDVADVNVLALAGAAAPGRGTWLGVAAAEARRGGEFTALFLRIASRERGTEATGRRRWGRWCRCGRPGPAHPG